MEKLTLRERIRITRRGFGVLDKYCPGLPRCKALSALISALQPFAAIWLSARIIGEIAGEKRIGELCIYVGAALLVNLAASILRGIIDKVGDQKEAQMWSFFGRVFSDKQLSMDYADIENAEIQITRKRAEENLFMFGNGLAQLVWGTAGLVRASVNIAVSISMTFTLFSQNSGNALMDSPVWIFVLFALILAGGLINQRATVRENEAFREWCKDTVWFNRTFMFFGRELYMNPDRAKDVRMYKQNRVASLEIKKLNEHGRRDNAAIHNMARPTSLSAIAVGIGNAACYLFVALKAFFGAFGVGDVVGYVGALSRLSEGVQEFMYILGDNETYCTHLRELFKYLDIPNKKRAGSRLMGEPAREIEFRDVSFKYQSSETYALRHVSFTLRAGQRCALVGMNGSGKTTFIKLLCRLYDPTEGEILLNGVNIREYDYDSYMALFAVVFQDFKLFSFSLAQNVAASVDYDVARVESCLIKAGFGERLREMPEGTETMLYKNFDEGGVEISGGEAQKIALARAIYKDAPFIVLDEPTAALDPVAEAEIYAKFDSLVGDKTAVYISHRLSSCRFCDVIAVFDGGRIAQYGSHEALLAEGGRYAELWHAQAKYYAR